MSTELSNIIVPAILGGLTSLNGFLRTCEKHVTEHSMKPEAFLDARLFPNMLPLTRQVQMSTDLARRGLDRLLARDLSSVEDNETSFEELIKRVDATALGWKDSDKVALNAASSKVSKVPMGKKESIEMTGQNYAMAFLIPNFYFHITTAYNILRHNGVSLGKKDFLAPILGGFR